MKHLVVGGLAALAIGLAGAPMAGADANDREFIKATDKVIMLHTGSDPDGHWVGYPGVPAQLRIDTAHTMCDMLDDNVTATFDTPARPWRSAQVPISRWCKPCSATRRRR